MLPPPRGAEFCGYRLDITIDPKTSAVIALWCG